MSISGIRVDPSHKWNQENVCRGCDCGLYSKEARDACPKPYEPRPMTADEFKVGKRST
jgi:hypothetical protein